MYLTSQHVENPDGEDGLNAFLYLHADQEFPEAVWANPDVVMIAEEAPGRLVKHVIEVQPGGNSVISYLDVVARNGTPYHRLESTLMHVRRQLLRDPTQAVWSGQPIGVRFSLCRGLVGRESEEFSGLMRAALGVLHASGDMVLPSGTPLTLRLAVDDEKAVFTLDEESSQRVFRQPECVAPQQTSISVKHDTQLAFEGMYGDLVPHIVTTLTNLPPDRVAELGGARIVRADSGQVVRQWLVAPTEDVTLRS